MVCEMVSRLARCTPDREVWFLALDWVILLRSSVQHFTLTALGQLLVVWFLIFFLGSQNVIVLI